MSFSSSTGASRLGLFLAGLVLLDRPFAVFRYDGWDLFGRVAEAKARQVAAYLKDPHGDPEVLVMGSSHAQFGLDPEVLSPILQAQVYNAALAGGGNVGDQRLLLEGLLARKGRVRRVIYGIEVFVLNYEPHAALNRLPEILGRKSWTEAAAAAWERLSRLSHAYAYGRGIHQYLEDIYEGKGASLPCLRSRGWEKAVFRRFDGFEVTPSGFVRGRGTLNTQYVRYGQHPFAPLPESVKALEDFVAFCRGRGIELAFVHIPEHYVARHPGEEHEKFNAFMSGFSRSHGVPYLDLNEAAEFPLDRDEYFFDSDHLNAEGARIFSRLLARRLSELQGARPR